MAEHANSTTVPSAHFPAPIQLPSNASPAWRDLWQSVGFMHPRATEAVLQAYKAGVDPSDLVTVQLCSPKHQIWAMPRLGFGGSAIEPDRLFGPNGEVSQ